MSGQLVRLRISRIVCGKYPIATIIATVEYKKLIMQNMIALLLYKSSVSLLLSVSFISECMPQIFSSALKRE